MRAHRIIAACALPASCAPTTPDTTRHAHKGRIASRGTISTSCCRRNFFYPTKKSRACAMQEQARSMKVVLLLSDRHRFDRSICYFVMKVHVPRARAVCRFRSTCLYQHTLLLIYSLEKLPTGMHMHDASCRRDGPVGLVIRCCAA